MRWTPATTALSAAMLVSAALVSTASAAGKSSAREAFYRCQGDNGQTYYGDRMPPACLGQDTEVLSDHGTVLRVIEGERSRAARLKREAAEAKVREAQDRQLQHDHMLIDTYLTVADIERLRDQRLDLLVAQYRVTEQNIDNLRERQSRLEAQIQRFRPYSDKPNAPPLPDHLAEEMVNTVKGMEVYKESLEKNRQEQADIRAAFDADIKRFKELKGLK